MWELKLKDPSKTKHEALVEHITKLIDDGKLKPGELLPTQREIAAKMKVSIGTVIKVFTELENRGYVFGEVGRGTFVSDYKYLSSTTKSELINLGNFESPDFTTVPAFRALQSGMEEVIRDSELYFKIGYIDPSGAQSHKAAASQWLKLGGIQAPLNSVSICGGAHHATYNAVQVLCQPGDYLMMEEMTMINIRDICKLVGVKVLPIKMDKNGILPSEFEKACKTGKSKVLYTIPSLQNPTCATMPRKRREDLVKIASRYKVTIIEDGVNDLLLDNPITPIVNLYPERTIYVTSLAKTISPGIRFGIMFAQPELIEKLEFATRASIWMNSPLLNEIATNLITSGKAKTLLLGKRQAIKQRQLEVAKQLKGTEFITHPNAFHIWMKLPTYWDSKSFSDELLKKNVWIRSADMFYVGNDTPPNYIRIGLGSAHSKEELSTGIERMLELMAIKPSRVNGF